MSYTLKHLGLGGILDQAIAIIRDHFILLFSIMLVVLVPVLLAQGFFVYAVTPSLPPNPTMQDVMHARQAQAHYWPWILGISLLEMVIVIPIANAAVIQAVARLYLGLPITATEAIAHGLRRFLPLLGTTVLMYLAIWGGLLLLVIPGLYFAIWFGLSQHVVVIEGSAGPTALGRSKKLVHKDRGTFLALMITLSVITFLIHLGVNYIPQPHLQVIAGSVLRAVTTMLWTASLVVFYFSCRCAVENFDLHHLAASIRPESTEGATATASTSA